MITKHVVRFVRASSYARVHSFRVELKTVFGFGYFTLSFDLLSSKGLSLQNKILYVSILFIRMQSLRVKVGARKAMNRTENGTLQGPDQRADFT